MRTIDIEDNTNSSYLVLVLPVRKTMAKKSKVRKGASKRRGGTKKTTPKKRTTRKSAPKTLTQEHRQLAVYHNPFSRATKQPKIPDGKVTESLGFQTQAVKELVPVTGGMECFIFSCLRVRIVV